MTAKDFRFRTRIGFEFEEFTLDLEARELLFGPARSQVRIAAKPYDALVFLLTHRRRVVSKDEIFKHVWGGAWNPDSSANTVDKAISEARKALKSALTVERQGAALIETVHGIGFRFVASVTVRYDYNVVAFLTVGCGSAVLVLALIAFARGGHRKPPPDVIRVGRSRAMTQSGWPKLSPALSDGESLYFTEVRNRTYRIGIVDIKSGSVSYLPSALKRPYACNISPDRRSLLVRDVNGDFDGYGPLYAQPISPGSARSLGVTGFDGSWTPDGRALVFAKGTDVSLLDIANSTVSRLATVPEGFCWWPRVSPDGSTVRFTVSDAKTQSTSLWEVAISGSGLHRVFSDSLDWARGACGNWTPDGRLFVFHAGYGTFDLWAKEEGRAASSQPVRLTHGPISFRGPTPSQDGRHLYARAILPRSELFKLNAKTGEQTLLFPGIYADTASFSKDGQWVAYYVTSPESSLWRSRTDGAERLKLVSAPYQSAFPQWSPDGEMIAVSTRTPEQPWTISLVSPKNGALKQLPVISANALNPSWSPDGKTIVFGTIPTLASKPGTVRIYRYEIRTASLSALPGSDELFSPAWSPDGQRILARNAAGSAIAVYDVGRQSWEDISTGTGTTGYAIWQNGRSIVFFQHSADGLSLNRIDLLTKEVKKLLAFKDMPVMERWIGIHPDGGIVVARDASVQEVYDLTLDH